MRTDIHRPTEINPEDLPKDQQCKHCLSAALRHGGNIATFRYHTQSNADQETRKRGE